MEMQVPSGWRRFYDKALVLALDVGIEGVGVWLRKGWKPLFAHTFLVSLPEAAPLARRRAKRAWRHARESRKRREKMLKEWIVRHGLLTQTMLDEMWANPKAFERPFEHRHRAIHNGVPSAHCLVICLRHLVKRRGFDYHLTEEGAYPWGEELDAKEIVKWAKYAPCAPEYRVKLLVEIQSDAPWAKDTKGEPTEKYQTVVAALDRAVEEYRNRPIERMLERHMVEKGHPNLRERARTHNFPRELVKDHLFEICEKHQAFFAAGSFEQAMLELLGKRSGSGTWTTSDGGTQVVLDYHRRTRPEAERLWLRKTNDCPYAEELHRRGRVPAAKIKCDLRSDGAVRRFNLAMFLAERRVELADGANSRDYLPVNVIETMFADLEQDISATEQMLAGESEAQVQRPKKPGANAFKKRFKDLKLAGKRKETGECFNDDFFDQLADLIHPELRMLRGRASLCAESARAIYEEMTAGGTILDPAKMRAQLKDCGYYDMRKDRDRSPGVYPQVEFLLGQRKHYDDEGRPRDVQGRKDGDGRAQHHGVLRKLFAGQLRLDDGTVVDLSEELDGAETPEFVIVETIGDMPRNEDERREMKKQNKESRARKNAIIEGKYGLKLRELSDSQIRRVLIFDQQANEKGEALSPYTGEPLGRNPLDPNLQIEHIFPEKRGGIWIMDNLAITTRGENGTKGNRTPFEWLERNVNNHLAAMNWNKAKRAQFCREESSCPQWDNTTRMAQIARHLRGEVIHWLGIRQKCARIVDGGKRAVETSREIAERIGTPVGGQTAACREEWLPRILFPQMYREVTAKDGRTYWSKNRLNLRHHLWDAAVLSHIPPGVGMNSVECGGIFLTKLDASGDTKITVLPGLGPDLGAFEKENAERCLVSKPRQAKSKKSRYKETIISLPDAEGKTWAREALAKIAAKEMSPGRKGDALTKVKKLLNRPGLLQPTTSKKGRSIAPLLTEKDVEAWWEGVQALAVNRQEFRAVLSESGIEREEIPPAAVEKLFANREKIAFKKPATLIAFIRKQCGKKAEDIPDARIEEVLSARAARAELRARSIKPGKPGQPIRAIRREQDEVAFSGAHHTPGGREPIGGMKAVDNSSSITYLRRDIWAGTRCVVRNGKATTEIFYEHRLIPHPRHLAAHKKMHHREWRAEPLPDGLDPQNPLCSLSVGDLICVPLKLAKRNRKDSLFAGRKEPYPGGIRFYRISALKSDSTVEMKQAEFDPPKIEKGKEPTSEQARQLATHMLSASRDEDLAWLCEFTKCKKGEPTVPLPDPKSDDSSSNPCQRKPGPSCAGRAPDFRLE